MREDHSAFLGIINGVGISIIFFWVPLYYLVRAWWPQ